MVEPVDPHHGGEFNRFEAAPRSAPMDDLGLVEAVDRFGEALMLLYLSRSRKLGSERRAEISVVSQQGTGQFQTPPFIPDIRSPIVGGNAP